MQVYKVIKTEHVRKRPKWLMRFLIKIPTELYEETTSTETAAGNLRAIGQFVLDSGVLEKRKGLQLQHVELLCHNRICHGVGIKNKHGGMEFFSSDLPMTLPITIDEPGTVCIPFKKAIRCKRCCLFVDLFDYLAYKTLLLKEQGRGLPERCDCIVLNDYRNLMDLLLDIEYYEHVSCCFPTSQTGKVLATTVMRRFKKSINCDYLYEGYDNLLALANEVVNRHKNDHIYV